MGGGGRSDRRVSVDAGAGRRDSPAGVVARVAFAQSDPNPPAIGNIAKGTYAFVGAARASDCSVVASGCTTANVNDSHDVSIQLGTIAQPAGACTAGQSCLDARCVPSIDNADGALGAGCSLMLVGAGPLGDALQAGGEDIVSAPGVAATESGFLIAYREYDGLAGRAQLTTASVSPTGGITIGSPMDLSGQCPNQDETDAVGLAYLGGTGVIVSARPGCSSAPGFDVFKVDATGSTQGTTFNPSMNGTPVLSNGHSAALSAAGNGWLAFVDSNGAELVGLSGLQTQGTPMPLGAGGLPVAAQVAATDRMIALLAATAPGSGAPPADAATSGDAAIAMAGDSGATTLNVQLGSSPAMLNAPVSFPDAWGALSAQSGRAFIVSNATSGGALQWRAMDLSSSAVNAQGVLPLGGDGDVLGADVALQGDYAAFAVEQAGLLSLEVLGHASTTPSFLRAVQLSGDSRIPSQTTVRDGRIAIAASPTQILVTWITATTLGMNDRLGGYALYACSP